jgi:glycosyltransferase involved in cell wall biosynthesis
MLQVVAARKTPRKNTQIKTNLAQMHIKFVSTMWSYPWGGSEVLWSETAKWLLAQGVKVSASVHCWPQPAPQVTMLRQVGINVWERWSLFPNRWQRLLRKFKLCPPVDLNEQAMKKWLLEGGPDLVCFSDGAVVCLPHFRFYCMELGLPYVNVAQLNCESMWPHDNVAEDQIKILGNAVRSFFVSQGNLNLCELQLGVRLQNAEIIRNPFAVNYDVVPSWPHVAEDELQLACVGRLEPNSKGQDLLFRVLAMEKWRARRVSVSMYGEGHMSKSLRRLAVFLGVENQVHFCGHVGDIESVWEKHHALVLPSRHEGLSLAGVEAMLCHRPVIATRVGGFPEVVEDGVNGFLASACTVEALNEALERAWKNRMNLREMGLKAGESIRKIMPQNPAKAFGERLIELAGEIQDAERDKLLRSQKISISDEYEN